MKKQTKVSLLVTLSRAERLESLLKVPLKLVIIFIIFYFILINVFLSFYFFSFFILLELFFLLLSCSFLIFFSSSSSSSFTIFSPPSPPFNLQLHIFPCFLPPQFFSCSFCHHILLTFSFSSSFSSYSGLSRSHTQT